MSLFLYQPRGDGVLRQRHETESVNPGGTGQHGLKTARRKEQRRGPSRALRKRRWASDENLDIQGDGWGSEQDANWSAVPMAAVVTMTNTMTSTTSTIFVLEVIRQNARNKATIPHTTYRLECMSSCTGMWSIHTKDRQDIAS